MNKTADGSKPDVISSRAGKNGKVRKINSGRVMNYGSCHLPRLIGQLPFAGQQKKNPLVLERSNMGFKVENITNNTTLMKT